MKIKAYTLNVFYKKVYPCEIIVENDIIKKVTIIGKTKEFKPDFEGILIPGFIDSHIHIESSMLAPAQFAKLAVRHGTTSVIADPHEIANVGGIKAIEYMINNAKTVPFDFYFTAPSCVPATSFETSGATLDCQDIEKLFQNDNIVALGEMMNFPGVISKDPNVIKKLELAKKYNKPIDGHAPLLSGRDLLKYVFWNISTDHECRTFDEALDKKNVGFKIMVREGSSAKNMDALFNYPDRIKFWANQESFGNITNNELEKNLKSPIFDFIVCDDINCKDLQIGHLNKLIKKAVELEVDVIEAIRMVTIKPAIHYKLNTGSISVGRKANFVLIDDFENFNIKKTFINGKLVFDGENVLFDAPSTDFKNTFDVSKKDEKDFDIFTNNEGNVNVRVIECFNGELITEEIEETLKVENNIIQADIKKDILKIAVVERYGGNTLSNAFIKGFNLKEGAIASSVSHDSHNIIVVGTNSKDMARAVNIIIENQGGLAIVSNKLEKSLALPICGLMTNESPEIVSEKLEELIYHANDFGCKLDCPFMALSFMALLVIPKLKLSNKGLFNVDSFNFVDVIKD